MEIENEIYLSRKFQNVSLFLPYGIKGSMVADKPKANAHMDE